jgi:hypothetical protein
VSIFGLTSRSVEFLYASAQPLDFLARTKNPSFTDGNCLCLVRGFRIARSNRAAYLTKFPCPVHIVLD